MTVLATSASSSVNAADAAWSTASTTTMAPNCSTRPSTTSNNYNSRRPKTPPPATDSVVGTIEDFQSVTSGTPTPPSSPGLSPAASAWHAFVLHKASQRIIGMVEAVLRPWGWTVRHFGVLCAIEAEPGQSQRILGERLRIDRTTVVALTDDLQKAGLLDRRRGVDRRTFSLHLTEAGHTHLEQLKIIVNDMHAEFLAPLSAAEQAMLHDLLLKLVTSPTRRSARHPCRSSPAR